MKKMSSINLAPAVSGDISGVSTQEGTQAVTNLPMTSVDSGHVTGAYGSVTTQASGETEQHASGAFFTETEVVSAGSRGVARVDQPMADTRFEKFLHRAVLIESFSTFNVTDYSATFYPWKQWAANPYVLEKINDFNFIRGSMTLRGVVKAPPLSSGLAILSFFPTYEATATTAVPKALSMVLPHVVIDLSASTPFEVTLPWVGPSNWGNLTDNVYAQMWACSFRVLTTIKSAVPDGCATAKLMIYATPGDDFQLSGGVFQSGRMSTGIVSSRPPPRPAPVAGNPGVIARDAAGAVKRKTGYKPSDWLTAASFGLGMAAVVPSPITPFAAAGAAVAGTIGKVLSFFGLTRETADPKLCEVVIKSTTNNINCDGEDQSRVAALFRVNAISTNPSISGLLSDLDDTSLAVLYGKYTHIDTFQWTVGGSNQDVQYPVTPAILSKFYEGQDPNKVLIPTVAGYVGARFRKWRGDVKFLIYPVVSSAHCGAMQLIWQPNPIPIPVGVDVTNMCANAVVDIAAGSPIEITIGYNNDFPTCNVDFFNLPFAPVTNDYATLNGYLRIRNTIPIAGSNCGDTLDFHVFAAAGENLDYGFPTDTMTVAGELKTFGRNVDAVITLQSGTIGEEGQRLIEIELVPSSGQYPYVENLMGEAIRSTRALMQKPSVMFNPGDYNAIPNGFSSTTTVMEFPATPFLGAYISSVNWFKYFGTMYLGYAGSIRRKVVAQESTGDNGLRQSLTWINGKGAEFAGGLPTSEFAPTWTTNNVQATELLMPYYGTELYVPAYKEGYGYQSLVTASSTLVEYTAQLYVSAGPDLRPTFFRAQNGFNFKAAPFTYFNFIHQHLRFLGPPGALEVGKEETYAMVDPALEGDRQQSQSRARTGRDYLRSAYLAGGEHYEAARERHLV